VLLSGGGVLLSGGGALLSPDPPDEPPLSMGGVPPSDGVLHGPQKPLAWPCPTTQASPAQQSALTVQPPQLATQLPPEKQTNPPPGPGTQGSPLQQSALVAQPCPGPTQAAPVHRGTPVLSSLQVSLFSQFPAQQSHEALQLIVASLHTSPFGLQPCGLRHTPSVDPAEKLHVTLPDPGPGNADEPQQSESLAHTSPTTWQPLAGWQMSTPVGPYGAHRRLQHDPPHVGIDPPPYNPPQTAPSTIEQFDAPPDA
jgi:hypothetical protein